MAITVPIISSFDGRGVSKAIRDFKALEGAGEKMGFALVNTTAAVNKGITEFAKFAAIGAGVAIVIGKELVDAAYEAEKVMKQTEAIILATGGAAGLTAVQVSNLSEKLSLQTGIDDELIQTSMNLLLTFKQVQDVVGEGNDIFTRASMAALDLGNVFGRRDAAAKMLGKALSDPTKGVSALARAGVNFSTDQKEMIKSLVDTGNVLDAQKLILQEVESQVGGTARASATAFDLMKVAVGNVAEDLGALLIPFVERFATYVTNVVLPKLEEFAQIVGTEGLGAGFKYLGEQGLIALGKLNGWGDLVYGVVTAVIALNVATGIYTGLQTFATIAMAAFGTAATGTAVAMNAAFFGIPALIGAVVVIITALALRFEGFREVIGKMIPVLRNVANFFLDSFVNPIVWGVNQLIKAYNGLPFLENIPLLSEINIGSSKAKKSVESLGNELTKLKPKLKLSGGALTPKKIPKTTGGGGGGGTTSATEKAKTALEKYTSALQLVDSETKQFNDAVKGVTRSQLGLANATDDVRVAQDKFNKVSKGYGANSKEAVKATQDLTEAQRDAVRAGYSLTDAQNAVLSAQQKLQNLLKPASVRSVQEATDDLTQANFDVVDAQNELNKARAEGTPREVIEAEIELRDAMNNASDAQQKLIDLQKAADPAEIKEAQDDLALAELEVQEALDAQKTAIENVDAAQQELNDVVNGAAVDSDKYKEALKELTDAQIAERDAVDDLTDAYDRQADAVRELQKAKDALAAAAKETTSKQEEQAREDLGIGNSTPSSGDAGGVLFGGLPTIDFSGIDFSGIDFSGIDFSGIGGLVALADGGIVNRPTLAMIGEGGEPEAVIPLSQLGNYGTGSGITVNITGGLSSSAEIGQAVVNAIRSFNVVNGPARIQVA